MHSFDSRNTRYLINRVRKLKGLDELKVYSYWKYKKTNSFTELCKIVLNKTNYGGLRISNKQKAIKTQQEQVNTEIKPKKEKFLHSKEDYLYYLKEC